MIRAFVRLSRRGGRPRALWAFQRRGSKRHSWPTLSRLAEVEVLLHAAAPHACRTPRAVARACRSRRTSVNIHSFIKQGRLRLGMSQERFAKAAGVSRGAVQQWEKPGGTAPRRANQPRLAQLMGISIAELMGHGVRASQPWTGSAPARVPVLP